MNSLEAAERVLQEVGSPMRPKEIAELMIEKGYWTTAGSTPDATVDARISVDIKENGSNSRFQRTAKSTFALRAWKLPEYDSQRSRTNKQQAKLVTNAPMTQPTPNHAIQKQATSSQMLSFTDAAEYVLKHHGNKNPMHYTEITR